MKKSAIAISIASAIFLIAPVLAQDSTSSTTVKPIRPALQKVEDKMQARKEANVEERRLMEASKAAIFRNKLDSRREFIASQEAKFRQKLQQFKDQQKAVIADRVNTNLNKINQNQTDHMLKNLDLMTQLLDKLQQRVNSLSPDIKDPEAANEAIADAREVIDATVAAVQIQSQKDYTITATAEARIGLNAKAKRDLLFKDIMAARKLVINSKQMVSNAIRIAKSGPKTATPSVGVREGTPSGQQ